MPRPEPVRQHALAVQRTADSLAVVSDHSDREALALAALLHDCGRLVMARMHTGYFERFDRRLAAPDERSPASAVSLALTMP